MKFEGYKLVFVVTGLIGVLLIATPALADLIRLPGGEQFSELYILGPDHMAENYPSNIAVGQNYSVYVDVGNHLGSSAYYVLYVKLGNQTDRLPNATPGTPSFLQRLYEYSFSLPDGENWESPLTFSVSHASISTNQSIVEAFIINGFQFNVNKPADWNANSTTFTYKMVFELWRYNSTLNSVRFDNRWVDLRLNLTETSQFS